MLPPSCSSVCIIGGGVCGIITASKIASTFHNFRVLERQPCLGGVWQWEDSSKSNLPAGSNKRELNFSNAMYRNLITNLPKELMELRDRPYPEGTPSFPPRETVLAYLYGIAEEAGLLAGGAHESAVMYNSQVISIRKQDNGNETGWTVQWKDVLSGVETQEEFDVVFVGNGQYNEAKEPAGMRAELLAARSDMVVMHSKEYDDPEDFRDKHVLLVGGGFSAADLLAPISKVAKRVGVYCRAVGTERATLSPVCRDYAQKAEAGLIDLYQAPPPDLAKFDAAIFCTGFEFEMNFLPPELRNTSRGSPANDLYLRAFHVDYPSSLILLGKLGGTYVFPLIEMQVEMALAFLSGRASFPPREDRHAYADEIIAKCKSTDPCVTSKLFLNCGEYWEELIRFSQDETRELDEARAKLTMDVFKAYFALPVHPTKFWVEAAKQRDVVVDWQTMTWKILDTEPAR